jgi:hypothetical protein
MTMPRRNGFRRCSRTIVDGEKANTSMSLWPAARIWSAGDTPPTKTASSSPAGESRQRLAHACNRGLHVEVQGFEDGGCGQRRAGAETPDAHAAALQIVHGADGRPAPDHEVQRVGVERGDTAQAIVGPAVELADERQIGGVREKDGDVHIALLERRHELAPAAIDELQVHVRQHDGQRLRQGGVQHRGLHRQDVEGERPAWRRRGRVACAARRAQRRDHAGRQHRAGASRHSHDGPTV